jgi:hypothetical protein
MAATPSSNTVRSELRYQLERMPPAAQALSATWTWVGAPDRLAPLARELRQRYASDLADLRAEITEYCRGLENAHYAGILADAGELVFIAQLAGQRLEAADRRSLLQPWHTLRHA